MLYLVIILELFLYYIFSYNSSPLNTFHWTLDLEIPSSVLLISDAVLRDVYGAPSVDKAQLCIHLKENNTKISPIERILISPFYFAIHPFINQIFHPSDRDEGVDAGVVWMWAMNCFAFITRNELNLSERRNACTKLRLDNCTSHKYGIRYTVNSGTEVCRHPEPMHGLCGAAVGCRLRYYDGSSPISFYRFSEFFFTGEAVFFTMT